MLGKHDASATLAVKDMAKARKFYEATLGLKLVHDQEGEALSFKSGSSTILVYHSQYAGTNQATAVTWSVDDIEGLVQSLKAKGIAFEHYDFPGLTLKGDVHVLGKLKVAWFKDPDGNIHALVDE